MVTSHLKLANSSWNKYICYVKTNVQKIDIDSFHGKKWRGLRRVKCAKRKDALCLLMKDHRGYMVPERDPTGNVIKNAPKAVNWKSLDLMAMN